MLIVVAALSWRMAAHAQAPAAAAQLTREGRALSPKQASDLEDRLKNEPEDLAARTRLLGYYFSSAVQTIGADATRDARRRHILWIIEHHPEADVTASSECTIDPAGHALADPDAYKAAKALWLGQTDQHKSDERILMHAARFFRLTDRAIAIDLLKQATTLSTGVSAARELGYVYAVTILGITMINSNGLPMNADPAAADSVLARRAIDEVRAASNVTVITTTGAVLSQYGVMVSMISKGTINRDVLAEELLKKAETLDPTDSASPMSLANMYQGRRIQAQTPAARADFAAKELEQTELALNRMAPDAESYPYALVAGAKAAVEANAIDTARQRATELLAGAVRRHDATTGQFIHDGHVVLGRVALRAGRIEEAKSHLLQASKVTGGGTLTSFGPNMSLAKELLERGERDTVVSYLQACESFWSYGGTARRWIETIKSGGTPNFGANLVY